MPLLGYGGKVLSGLGRSPMATSAGLSTYRTAASRQDGMTGAEVQAATGQDEGFFGKFGAWLGAPFYTVSNLLMAPVSDKPGERVVNALENLTDFFTGAPTLGLFNPFRMAKDQEERPEFSELMEAYGAETPDKGSWGRLGWDVAGGMGLDPLSWISFGGAGALKGMLKSARAADAGIGVAKATARRGLLDAVEGAMMRRPLGKKLWAKTAKTSQEDAFQRFAKKVDPEGAWRADDTGKKMHEMAADYATSREKIELARKQIGGVEYDNMMSRGREFAGRVWGHPEIGPGSARYLEGGFPFGGEMLRRPGTKVGRKITLQSPKVSPSGPFGRPVTVDNAADYMQALSNMFQRGAARPAATRYQGLIRGANRRASSRIIKSMPGATIEEQVLEMARRGLIEGGGARLRMFMPKGKFLFPGGVGQEVGPLALVKSWSIPGIAYRLLKAADKPAADAFALKTEMFGTAIGQSFNKLFRRHPHVRAIILTGEGLESHWNDVARHVYDETFSPLSKGERTALGQAYVWGWDPEKAGSMTDQIMGRLYENTKGLGSPELWAKKEAQFRKAIDTFSDAMGRGGMNTPIGNMPGLFADAIEVGWFPYAVPLEEAPHYIPWQVSPEISSMIHAARLADEITPGTSEQLLGKIRSDFMKARLNRDWPGYVKSMKKTMSEYKLDATPEKDFLNLDIGDLFLRRIAAHARESTKLRMAKKAAEVGAEVTGETMGARTASQIAKEVAKTAEKVDDVTPSQWGAEDAAKKLDTPEDVKAAEEIGAAGEDAAPAAPGAPRPVPPEMVEGAARAVSSKEQALDLLRESFENGNITEDLYILHKEIYSWMDKRLFDPRRPGAAPFTAEGPLQIKMYGPARPGAYDPAGGLATPSGEIARGRREMAREGMRGLQPWEQKKLTPRILGLRPKTVTMGFYKEAENFIGVYQRPRSLGKHFKTVAHELGHAGYRIMLSADDHARVYKLFDEMGGLTGRTTATFNAENVHEYFALAFDDWIQRGVAASDTLLPMFRKVYARIEQFFRKLLDMPQVHVHDDMLDMFRRIAPHFEPKVLARKAGSIKGEAFRASPQSGWRKAGKAAESISPLRLALQKWRGPREAGKRLPGLAPGEAPPWVERRVLEARGLDLSEELIDEEGIEEIFELLHGKLDGPVDIQMGHAQHAIRALARQGSDDSVIEIAERLAAQGFESTDVAAEGVEVVGQVLEGEGFSTLARLFRDPDEVIIEVIDELKAGTIDPDAAEMLIGHSTRRAASRPEGMGYFAEIKMDEWLQSAGEEAGDVVPEAKLVKARAPEVDIDPELERAADEILEGAKEVAEEYASTPVTLNRQIKLSKGATYRQFDHLDDLAKRESPDGDELDEWLKAPEGPTMESATRDGLMVEYAGRDASTPSRIILDPKRVNWGGHATLKHYMDAIQDQYPDAEMILADIKPIRGKQPPHGAKFSIIPRKVIGTVGGATPTGKEFSTRPGMLYRGEQNLEDILPWSPSAKAAMKTLEYADPDGLLIEFKMKGRVPKSGYGARGVHEGELLATGKSGRPSRILVGEDYVERMGIEDLREAFPEAEIVVAKFDDVGKGTHGSEYRIVTSRTVPGSGAIPRAPGPPAPSVTAKVSEQAMEQTWLAHDIQNRVKAIRGLGIGVGKKAKPSLVKLAKELGISPSEFLTRNGKPRKSWAYLDPDELILHIVKTKSMDEVMRTARGQTVEFIASLGAFTRNRAWLFAKHLGYKFGDELRIGSKTFTKKALESGDPGEGVKGGGDILRAITEELGWQKTREAADQWAVRSRYGKSADIPEGMSRQALEAEGPQDIWEARRSLGGSAGRGGKVLYDPEQISPMFERPWTDYLLALSRGIRNLQKDLNREARSRYGEAIADAAEGLYNAAAQTKDFSTGHFMIFQLAKRLRRVWRVKSSVFEPAGKLAKGQEWSKSERALRGQQVFQAQEAAAFKIEKEIVHWMVPGNSAYYDLVLDPSVRGVGSAPPQLTGWEDWGWSVKQGRGPDPYGMEGWGKFVKEIRKAEAQAQKRADKLLSREAAETLSERRGWLSTGKIKPLHEMNKEFIDLIKAKEMGGKGWGVKRANKYMDKKYPTWARRMFSDFRDPSEIRKAEAAGAAPGDPTVPTVGEQLEQLERPAVAVRKPRAAAVERPPAAEARVPKATADEELSQAIEAQVSGEGGRRGKGGGPTPKPAPKPKPPGGPRLAPGPTPLVKFHDKEYEKEIYKLLDSIPSLRGNWRYLSHASQILRAALTVGTLGLPNPAFHARNMFSTMFQSLLDEQVGPVVAFKTNMALIADLPLMRAAGFARRSEAMRFYKAMAGDASALEGMANIGSYTPQEIVGHIQRLGVVSADFSSVEVATTRAANFKSKEAFLNLLKGGGLPRQVAHKIESAHRTAAFIKLLREAATPEDAAERVGRMFVRYNYASIADKAVREIFPFIKFRMSTIPAVIEEGLKRPLTIQPLLRAKASQEHDATLPEYVKEGLHIPIGRGPGGPMMLSGLGFIQEELGSLLSPGGVKRTLQKEVLGRLHPFMKVPLEMLTDRNFYFGTKAGDYRKYPDISLEGEQLLGMTPFSRMANTIRKAFDPKKPGWARALNALTGVRIATIDEERELRRLLEAYFVDRAQTDRNLRSFTSFYQKGEVDPELEKLLDRWKQTRTKRHA